MIENEYLRATHIETRERTGDERVHDDLDGEPRNRDGSNTGYFREAERF